MSYRKVKEMTADEMLSHLTTEPQYQLQLFIKMGGDPNDHNYAYLSYLTKQLRERGVPVRTSRRTGVWLEEEK